MMKKHHIVIVAGGTIGDWAWKHVQAADLLIGADRGAWWLVQQGFQPDVALGDFDSVSAAERVLIRQQSKQWIPCDPVHKDETDTELALRWALEQQPASIVMLGVFGSRFDHTLANVYLLCKAAEQQGDCQLIDDRNVVRLIDQEQTVTLSRASYPYVSLLPLTSAVSGITLEGFQYPLTNATLRMGQTIGMSNVLTEPVGRVTIQEGQLLLVCSSDQAVV